MDFHEVLYSRHSVRDFTSEQIPRETVREIIRDARRAPSWIDAQEGKVYIADGAILAKFRSDFIEAAEKGVESSSEIHFAGRNEWSLNAQKNMGRFVREFNNLMGDEYITKIKDALFNAPVILFLTLPRRHSSWAVLDLGAFEMALLLSATSRGLGSIVAQTIVRFPEIIRRHFPIPEDEIIVVGIALGHESGAKVNSMRSPRVDLSEIIVESKAQGGTYKAEYKE